MLLLNKLLNSIILGYKYNATTIYFYFKKSKLVVSILKVLTKKGYILGFSKTNNLSLNYIIIKLKYNNKIPAIKNIIFFYNFTTVKIKALLHLNKNKKNIVLSNKHGITTSSFAIKNNTGGQILFILN
jgi:ribosomal protein S8